MFIRNEKGQSLLEFLLTFAFAIGFSFIFLFQSLNYALGFATHYVGFMGSRVFLSFDGMNRDIGTNLTAASNEAKRQINFYDLESIGLKPKVNFNLPRPSGSTSNLFSGLTLQFKRRMSPFAVIGGDKKATFLSESFLGKEPMRINCYTQVCTMTTGRSSCNSNMDITLFDNGC